MLGRPRFTWAFKKPLNAIPLSHGSNGASVEDKNQSIPHGPILILIIIKYYYVSSSLSGKCENLPPHHLFAWWWFSGNNHPRQAALLPARWAQGSGRKKTKGKKTKKKKDKDNQPTVKNFGSRLNINKLKGVSKLIIGWRIRPVLGVGSLHSILLNAGCTPMCCHTILTILYICPAFVHGPSEAGYRGRQQISDADSPYLLPRWRAGSWWQQCAPDVGQGQSGTQRPVVVG